MSLDALYRGVVIGNWLVFGGVVVEETPALLTFTTFIKEKFFEKRSRTGGVVWIRKREKIFESIGLVVLLLGLLLESQYEGAARSSEANARVASERTIVDLESRATAAEGKIAETKRDAAKATLEAERLKALVQWRNVTPQQTEQMAAELGKEKGTVTIAYFLGDPETELFAFEISRMISAVDERKVPSQWKGFIQGRTYSDRVAFGISIPGPENAQVTAIRRAFKAADIPFDTNDVPDPQPPIPVGNGLTWTPPPKEDALIMVWLRPPPIQLPP